MTTQKYQYTGLVRKVPTATLTVSPTPSDANVLINGTSQSTITVDSGTEVDVTVYKTGYVSSVVKILLNNDYTYSPTLGTSCTYTLIITGGSASLSLTDSVNNATATGNTVSLNTVAGRTVTATISRDGSTIWTGNTVMSINTKKIVDLSSLQS